MVFRPIFLILMFLFFLIPRGFSGVDLDQLDQILKKMVNENVLSSSEAEKILFKAKKNGYQQLISKDSKSNKIKKSKKSLRIPASELSSDFIFDEVGADLDSVQFEMIQEEIQLINP
jgi:predicted ATP-dependent Lon-type protease